jgi:hypothetical protein
MTQALQDETQAPRDLRLHFFTPETPRTSRAFKGYMVRLVASSPGQPTNYIVISLDNSGG